MTHGLVLYCVRYLGDYGVSLSAIQMSSGIHSLGRPIDVVYLSQVLKSRCVLFQMA